MRPRTAHHIPTPKVTPGPTPKGTRRGLTLLESLLAVAVLLLVTTAVMSALTAGHAQSAAGRRTVAATLACEMLMARITGLDPATCDTDETWYKAFTDPAESGGWNGHTESPGDIRAGNSPVLQLLPPDYQDFSLTVTTNQGTHLVGPPLSVAIQGVDLRVDAADKQDRPLASISRFVPLPQVLEPGS